MIKKFSLVLFTLVLLSPAYVYATPGVLFVDFEGKSVNVNYDAEGIEILDYVLEEDAFSAIIILEVEVSGSPGILEITLDRNFIDSTYQGADDLFFVLADGDEPSSEEIATTTQSRTLRIELPAGTEEVEIIGTEFVMEETTAPPPPPPPPLVVRVRAISPCDSVDTSLICEWSVR